MPSVAAYREGGLVHSWSGPAGVLCSSYAAEAVAMREAVEWLEEREGWTRALVATDSRALVMALDGRCGGPGAGRIRETLWRLHESGREVTLAWIPGHCDVRGNEEADRLAGEGSGMEQGEVPLEGATRRALIRRRIRAGEVRHQRLEQVYRGSIREAEEEALSRRDRVDLTRFRTGHHPALRRWLVMVGREECELCRLCGMGRRRRSTYGWGATPSCQLDNGTSSGRRWPSWWSDLRRRRRC